MQLLNDHDVSERTIKQVIEDAELSTVDQFELMHICLNGGKEMILAVITGDYLDPVSTMLEALNEIRSEV
ncbi:hypothetical protein BR1R5_34210 [Pseudomonas sp. BR1R-5]|jgi:hypothetical protein|uniref:hypothetical protein n=1 Tax=Pseudomonas sp. BR1R-5 TaxID=3003626 RepID=UPI0022BFBDA5|nr:hypothetical protein [Pseudomonas sp. BR1R-5]GLH34033.1 hypothetical protein BR1R5_34210 [Pseudomonas sp. BR1R-5]